VPSLGFDHSYAGGPGRLSCRTGLSYRSVSVVAMTEAPSDHQPLKIVRSELDGEDKTRQTFLLHLSRVMTDSERDHVADAISRNLSQASTKAVGPAIVAVKHVSTDWLETNRNVLQRSVAEGTQAAARADEERQMRAERDAQSLAELKRRAAGIDWSAAVD
jgi:hypothetical protein